jgi:hypothetical protein
MEKITFEYLGVVMMEPMALIFNWIIAIQCFIYAKRIRVKMIKDTFASGWYRFFLFFGYSTLFGGLSHLFFHYTGMLGKIPGWSFAIIMISYLELAIASQTSREPFLKKIVWVSTVVLGGLMLAFLNFTWVTIHTAIGLVLFLGVVSSIKYRQGAQLWKEYVIGIIAMLLTLPFIMGKIDLHLWFNRHDISHLLMIIALYYFQNSTTKIINEKN